VALCQFPEFSRLASAQQLLLGNLAIGVPGAHAHKDLPVVVHLNSPADHGSSSSGQKARQ